MVMSAGRVPSVVEHDEVYDADAQRPAHAAKGARRPGARQPARVRGRAPAGLVSRP